MAFYRKIYNPKLKLYYPMAVTIDRPMDTRELADRLATLSTVSRSDVWAVLGNLASVMAEGMAQGRAVRLDGLGTFRYTLSASGVGREEDFDFRKQAKAVRVSFVPERRGRKLKGSKTRSELVPDGIDWIEWT